MSIKVAPPDFRPARTIQGPVLPGGKYVDPQAALARLIIFAYPQFASPGKTLLGLPEWAYGTSLFAIAAEPARSITPSLPEMRRMMAAVLADRFQFKFHTERHSMQVLLLTVKKGGVRNMQKSARPANVSIHFGTDRIISQGTTADGMAAMLGFYFPGRPVMNRTGLAGFYDVDVPAIPRTSPGLEGDQARILGDLGILGLALRPARATVPVMVVDHVSMPSPN